MANQTNIDELRTMEMQLCGLCTWLAIIAIPCMVQVKFTNSFPKIGITYYEIIMKYAAFNNSLYRMKIYFQ